MIAIGTRVRVVQPTGSVFFGHIGVVVERPGPRGKRRDTNAIRFPGHPWQEKRPRDCWFFDDDELETEDDGDDDNCARPRWRHSDEREDNYSGDE